MDEPTKRRFRSDPATFLVESIRDFTLSSPLNRLPAFDDAPIFGEPLVGFADGDDSIFAEYKTVIADFHLTPREALAGHPTIPPAKAPPAPPTSAGCPSSWIRPRRSLQA